MNTHYIATTLAAQTSSSVQPNNDTIPLPVLEAVQHNTNFPQATAASFPHNYGDLKDRPPNEDIVAHFKTEYRKASQQHTFGEPSFRRPETLTPKTYCNANAAEQPNIKAESSSGIGPIKASLSRTREELHDTAITNLGNAFNAYGTEKLSFSRSLESAYLKSLNKR